MKGGLIRRAVNAVTGIFHKKDNKHEGPKLRHPRGLDWIPEAKPVASLTTFQENELRRKANARAKRRKANKLARKQRRRNRDQ